MLWTPRSSRGCQTCEKRKCLFFPSASTPIFFFAKLPYDLTSPYLSTQPMMQARKSPKIWLLRIVGYTSLTAAFLSALLYWYRAYTRNKKLLLNRRKDDGSPQQGITDASAFGTNHAMRRISSSMRDITSLQVCNASRDPSTALSRWLSRLMD